MMMILHQKVLTPIALLILRKSRYKNRKVLRSRFPRKRNLKACKIRHKMNHQMMMNHLQRHPKMNKDQLTEYLQPNQLRVKQETPQNQIKTNS
jgi:hypothetical protein